jgi:hypothetical protein
MLWRTLATTALVLLSACTVIKIEGNSNSVGDSGNHHGRLTWPEMTAPDASAFIARPPEECSRASCCV